MQVQEWTLAKWADRASASYVGIDRNINNITIDAYGRKSGTADYKSCCPRRPVKTEAGETATYVMYDDDTAGPVPIIRISEVSE